ncbi:MAG TPA: hypothetical protein O0X70_00590 [Methanocorpusculum sp.]|nr:hypothetical protein [Methanocorpusculum sp.]
MFDFALEYPDEFYEHYRLRNNVESTFKAIKMKLGEDLTGGEQLPIFIFGQNTV